MFKHIELVQVIFTFISYMAFFMLIDSFGSVFLLLALVFVFVLGIVSLCNAHIGLKLTIYSLAVFICFCNINMRVMVWDIIQW